MNPLDVFLAELRAVIDELAPPDGPVTPADFMRAAVLRDGGGLFPDRPAFAPAVPYRKD